MQVGGQISDSAFFKASIVNASYFFCFSSAILWKKSRNSTSLEFKMTWLFSKKDSNILTFYSLTPYTGHMIWGQHAVLKNLDSLCFQYEAHKQCIVFAMLSAPSQGKKRILKAKHWTTYFS